MKLYFVLGIIVLFVLILPLGSAIHTISFFQIDVSNSEEVAVILPVRYPDLQRAFERDFHKFNLSVDGKQCEFLGEQYHHYFFDCEMGETLRLENNADITGYVHFFGYAFVNSEKVIKVDWNKEFYEIPFAENSKVGHTHIALDRNMPIRKDFSGESESVNLLVPLSSDNGDREDLIDYPEEIVNLVKEEKKVSFIDKIIGFFRRS